MTTRSSRAVVIVALVANAAIATLTFAGFLPTRSPGGPGGVSLDPNDINR